MRSYTLETTYNGCDQGQLCNMQITEAELCELGVGLLSSIYVLKVNFTTHFGIITKFIGTTSA